MLEAELNRHRRIGVEHEFAIPRIGVGSRHEVQQEIANVMCANGIPAVARQYSHAPLPPGKVIAIEYDTSVRGESRWSGVTWIPIELKTKPLTLNEWEQLVPKALQIARYLGGRITASAGHHVHVDLPEIYQRPKTIRSIYNLLHRFEPVLFGLVPPSRRTGSYSSPMPDRGKLLHRCRALPCFERALADWPRHSGINFRPVFGSSEPNIEFRYSGGTLDPSKARHWLRLCMRLVDHACIRSCHGTDKQYGCDRRGFEALRTAIGLKPNSGIYKVSPELRETGQFLLKRFREFNPDTYPMAKTGGR